MAGPVVAAAVILPNDYYHPLLNDSKKLSPKIREVIAKDIKSHAVDFAIGVVEPEIIDEINILNATFLAMNQAISKLSISPELLLIDGNRFINKSNIPHLCIIKGDATYKSIAAASVIAKTHRDRIMKELSLLYPHYQWNKNKGYPTLSHRVALHIHGCSPLHRKSFNLSAPGVQLPINFGDKKTK